MKHIAVTVFSIFVFLGCSVQPSMSEMKEHFYSKEEGIFKDLEPLAFIPDDSLKDFTFIFEDSVTNMPTEVKNVMLTFKTPSKPEPNFMLSQEKIDHMYQASLDVHKYLLDSLKARFVLKGANVSLTSDVKQITNQEFDLHILVQAVESSKIRHNFGNTHGLNDYDLLGNYLVSIRNSKNAMIKRYMTRSPNGGKALKNAYRLAHELAMDNFPY